MSKKSADSFLEQPLRFGTVPFCNAWPLTQYLPERFPGSTFSTLYPSRMRFRLITHHLDLVLMSVIELMNIPSGMILGDVCIGCRGAVKSVLLYSRKPLKEVRTIAMDMASRSSVTLADVILRTFYENQPQKYQLPVDADPENNPCDAMVLIGDRALSFVPSDRWEHRFDLGELWYHHTGMPFVFAAWIACTDKRWRLSGYLESLQNARDEGLKSIETIVQAKQANLPIPSRERVIDYLQNSICYRIGAEERKSMNDFFNLACIHQIIPHRHPLIILDS